MTNNLLLHNNIKNMKNHFTLTRNRTMKKKKIKNRRLASILKRELNIISERHKSYL